ncbi:hypothetical protein RUM43_011797 [Polyplax serrata]|uniref:Uncharacterized protein n=1 Tax=Polyplax serrata TaxID=468196 RepID=A0AAN8S7E2_POLSC
MSSGDFVRYRRGRGLAQGVAFGDNSHRGLRSSLDDAYQVEEPGERKKKRAVESREKSRCSADVELDESPCLKPERERWKQSSVSIESRGGSVLPPSTVVCGPELPGLMSSSANDDGRGLL